MAEPATDLVLDLLRSLPDGSLSKAEVRILCDEIERLRGEVDWMLGRSVAR